MPRVSVMRPAPICLIALVAVTLAGCGGGPADPLREQFTTDMEEQDDRGSVEVGEAFVSTWTDSGGATRHATCVTRGSNPDKPMSVVIYPHEGGVKTVERAGRSHPDWQRYCASPANDASGAPLRYLKKNA